MTEYGAGHSAGHAQHRGGPISVGWVLLASTLIGAGLFTIFFWLYTFNLEWSFGILLVLAGGLMLFSPRAGADHA
jgi:uncharacterized membrane protein YfcA